MNLAFLAPAALAALAALLVPLLIHLQRRPEQRVVEFAALRWLSERVRPRQRLRLSEWLLLLLRLLLVAALALWLAQPAWLDYLPRARAWELVVPGIDPATLPAPTTAPAPDRRWLAPGFPALDTPSPGAPAAVASLLRDLDTRLRPEVDVAVWVPRELAGLDAERIRLSRTVAWRVVDAAPAPTAAPASAAAVVVAIRHADVDEPALRYLEAAVAAWNTREPGRYRVERARAEVALPDDADWLVWIGGEPPAPVIDWVRKGGHALVLPASTQEPASVAPPVPTAAIARRSLGRGQLASSTLPLRAEAWPTLLDAGFPSILRDLLQGEPAPPDRADAPAVRPAADGTRLPPPAYPVADWLALAIALLLLAERLLATRTAWRAPA